MLQKYCYHSSFGLTDIEAKQTRWERSNWRTLFMARIAFVLVRGFIISSSSIQTDSSEWSEAQTFIFTAWAFHFDESASAAVIMNDNCCCNINAVYQCDGENSNNFSTNAKTLGTNRQKVRRDRRKIAAQPTRSSSWLKVNKGNRKPTWCRQVLSFHEKQQLCQMHDFSFAII